MTATLLPSWRPGPVRDAVVTFLDDLTEIAPSRRLACFDNDGTLWCERPTYAQLDFFLDELRTRAAVDPSVREKPELAALLSGDRAAWAEMGLERLAIALTGLFEGRTPEEFAARVTAFMERSAHPTLHRSRRSTVYQPMLELIDELRRRDTTVAVVTGGGTEFVRAVSHDLYGVPPEAVVGTLIEYEYSLDDRDTPVLRRTTRVVGAGNEGATKVSNVQAQLGRRPVVAAGNSGGDRQMLQWAAGDVGPALALLIDHDDAEREFAYVGAAETVTEDEPITDVANRLGWTVVSMARDWSTIFA